uniref:P-type ATPase C-terminal domain-containing protein n=1 Tax=Setaria digitata TaxID=48799 RepID=A0A915Q6M5_9BILA
MNRTTRILLLLLLELLLMITLIMMADNSEYLPNVRPDVAVKSSKKSFLNGWWMSSFALLTCRSSTNSNRKHNSDGNNQFTESVLERILRANDREFNEQFKYALIPWISSIVWYSTAIPLFVVLAFSAAKDAYDDIQRHRSDSQVNNRISYVVRNGQLIGEKWMNVKVGDIIRMENNQFVAADLLLLSTSEPHGLCYIETAELDGETNLKVRQALPETFVMGDKLLQISEFKGKIHCELPNNKLNQFEGRLHYNGTVLPLDNGQTLLRGCVLRNTRWCYGVVIFAGKDTKLMMNSGKTKCKRTSLDRFLNILIMGGDIAAHARTTTLNEELGQVQYIFSDKTGTLTQNTMIFRKCSINGHSYGDVYDENGEIVDVTEKTSTIDFSKNPWYEPNFKFYDHTLLKDTTEGLHEVTEFWRLLALCHTSMPEEKNGRLEYQAQSPDEAALTSAARNFGYVFKSRTAQTITLEVDGCEEVYDLLAILDFNNVRKRMSVIVRNPMGELILYCKGADTIIIDRISHDTTPLLKNTTIQHLDKFAADGLRTLCLAYKKISVDVFNNWHERQKKAALAMTNRQEQLDQVYDELEQEMILLGATAIEDKLQDGVPDTIAELARANIKIWILTGDKQETAINIGYSCHLLTEDLREVFVIDGETEHEVEIQLKDIRRRIEQTLGPPSSMKTNAVMNYIQQIISKVEEAEKNESKSDGRFHKTDYCLYTRNDFHPDALSDDVNLASQYANDAPRESDAQIQYQFGSNDWENSEGYALVINGPSLTYALKRKLERTFLDIGCLCRAVVCCRVTPLQKALVVDLVKRNKKAVTLAVGDGANDVSMIKTAHIGVGISGQEGMQAVLASDYSIGQFRYLRRLLLVHGRWSYFRMTKFLQYFFYKNFAFTLTHFWYSFFCGYSAQSIYNPVLIAFYNLFFTSLPVLAMGIFDQDVDDLCGMKYAKLYIPGQYNLFFNMRTFIYSVLHGMISSLVIFFIPYGVFCNGVDSTGRDFNDYSLLAFTCFTSLIIVVTGQIAFDTSYWTIFNHIVIWGSVVFYFGLSYILYEASPIRLVSKLQSAQSYGVMQRAFTSLQFWLSLLMVSVILLLPVLINRFFWLDTHPTYADRLRMRRKLLPSMEDEKPESVTKAKSRSITARRSRGISIRSGYAFSHQQGFGDLILRGELFKQMEQLINPGSPHLSPQKIISPIRQLAEKGATTVITPITLLSQRSNKIAPLEQVKEESKQMNTEFKVEGPYKNNKQNVKNPNNMDEIVDMSQSYLHNIIVNDDEELPFKQIVKNGEERTPDKLKIWNEVTQRDIPQDAVNRTGIISSISPSVDVKQKVFLQSFRSLACPNSLDSGSFVKSSTDSAEIITTKRSKCKQLNETRL